MVVFAAWTVQKRAPEVPGVLPLALAALGMSTAITCLVIFGLGIFPPEARAIVPVGGMMVGHAMASTVLAGRRLVSELSEKRAEVGAHRAPGHPLPDAARTRQSAV